MTPAPRFARWWIGGFALGLRALAAARSARDLREALRLLFCPIDLWRYYELAAVLDAIGEPKAVFDIGSPKVVSELVRTNASAAVWCSDIAKDALRPRAACRVAVQCDATHLPFPDASLPCIISVSAIEHIAGEGDSAAVREVARVLAPGGVAVITVPVVSMYTERWVESDPYGGQARGADGSVFFSRYYDWPALQERIVVASGMRVVRMHAWEEVREGWYKRYCRATVRPMSMRAIAIKALDIGWARRRLGPVTGGPEHATRHGVAALVLQK